MSLFWQNANVSEESKVREEILNIKKKIFTVSVAQVAQIGGGHFILGNSQKPSGHRSERPALGGPAWAAGVGQMTTFRGCFQFQPFCDSDFFMKSYTSRGEYQRCCIHPFLFLLIHRNVFQGSLELSVNTLRRKSSIHALKINILLEACRLCFAVPNKPQF